MKLAFYNAWQPRATKFDKLVAACSWGMFSHVELVFSDHMWFSISPREGVARFKPIIANLGSWEFIYLDKISKDEEKLLKTEAIKLIGKKYDYIGAIFSIAPFCIQKENRLFCSEASVTVLKKIPQFSFLKRPCTYSPNDLYKELKGRNFRATL